MTESGIYQITSICNGRIYIGSSKNLEQRKKNHFRCLKYNRHENNKLQRAYNKYGVDNFTFEVLLYCTPDNCLLYEQFCLDNLNPYFNINRTAFKPPSRKNKTWKNTDTHRQNCKTAALLREKENLIKKFEEEKELYEKIKESNLSVRKFCALHGLMANRTSINKRYKKYLKFLEEQLITT